MIKKLRYVAALAAAQLAACTAEPARESQGDATAVNGSGTSAPAATSAQEPRAQERLVLAFGDSLYAGYGLDRSQALPAVLERELEERGIPANVVNAGASGDTTAGGLRRLAFTLDGLERTPDLVIVGLGANDFLRGVDPAETRRNMDAILEELKRRGIPVVLTGMMAPRNLDRSYIRSFESIYPELASKYGAQLDPFLLEGVITRPDLLLDDGMHPNAKGVETMAERLAPKVAQALAVPAKS
ncbi:MAG: arylesterase [Sphingomonas sp.]|nr:arylesterase [Sphingomonas sp.]